MFSALFENPHGNNPVHHVFCKFFSLLGVVMFYGHCVVARTEQNMIVKEILFVN